MKRSIVRFREVIPAALIACCLGTPLPAQPESVTLPADPDKLHAILQSEAGRFRKILACKKLGRVGTRDSVPVLAELLTNPELSHAARIGLEAIPTADAGAALREAVSKLDGKQLVGVLNSIGARRDEAAVGLLQELIQADDPRVARAAAFALGRIANDDAAAALSKLLSGDLETVHAAAVRAAAGKACVMAAEQCRREGGLERAREISVSAVQSPLPRHVRLGAQRTLLLASDTLDADRWAALIKGESEAEFRLALTVAREFSGTGVNEVISAQLDNVPISRQVRLITALGERGDVEALSTVLAAVRSDHQAVRQAAVRSLAYFRDESVWPRLLDMACNRADARSDVARDALVRLDNPELDAMILEKLDGADSETRVALYDLIGRRRISEGVSALLRGMEAEAVSERLAAIESLGRTLPADRLDVLTARLLAKPSSEERRALLDALRDACVRLGDAEPCARRIVECLPETSGELTMELYELLGTVGGSTALQAFTEAVKDPSPAMQDTLTRVLGEWMSPDAAPLLLEIANSDMEEKYRIRALRGYIRILRQFDMTKRERIEMCQKAMPVVQREQERLLMLEALSRVPAPQTLSLAVTQLSHANVRPRAGEVALSLGANLVERHPRAVIEATEKVLATVQDEALKQRARQLLDQAQKNKGA
ncbi:MAG: HEAT repeat domain-containing protein [Planctomycetota bacterium]